MINIDLYTNLSEPNIVNKYIKYLTTITGDFRSSASITNPIIEVESDANMNLTSDIVILDNELVVADDSDITISTSNKIIDCNYIYIREMNRYYYVNDITFMLNKLYIFSCSVDLLMSNKDDLLDLYGYIERNEFTYNELLEDNLQPFEFTNDIEIMEVDTSDNDLTFKTDIGYTTTDLSYVLSYYSDEVININNYTTEIYAPENRLNNIKPSGAGQSDFTRLGCMNLFGVTKLANDLAEHESHSTFITGLICYPFILQHGTNHALRLGDDDVDVNIYDITRVISDYYLLGKFQFNKSSYLDVEPYSTYELYLPFVDFVTLKSSDILGCEIRIYYVIDYANGTGNAIIYNHTKDYVISSYKITIGVKIPLNTTNAQSINDSKNQVGINIATSTIAGTLGGAIKGGVAGAVIGGLAGLGISSFKGVETLSYLHEKASAGVHSGYEGVYNPLLPYIKKTKYVKKTNTEYQEYFGKPFEKYEQLSALKGFTKIKDIHLNSLKITKSEIDELYTLLTNGIIL